MAGIKWQYLVVKGISGGNRRFRGVQLAMRHLVVGVDERLPVNAAYALEIAYIKRVLRDQVLRDQVVRVHGLDLTASDIIFGLALRGGNLRIRQLNAFIGNSGFQRLIGL